MRTPATLLLLLLTLLPVLAPASARADLFVAEGPVADEGSETRNAALSGLLGEVLMRVSGNPGIAGQPAARELLGAAPSLVQQYRYRTADRGGEVVRYLWARFDQPAVERMMRERNLPVWVQRPGVLMWIAAERDGQRTLLNLDAEPEARAALLAEAQRRGMPLQLPLMDLEDQTLLTPADLWSDYQAAIQQASARYPHDLVVVGRLRAQAKGRWAGTWSILDLDGGQGFQAPAQPLPEALAFAVDQVQNLLAARYAPMPGAGGSRGTLVQFSAVTDLAAYGRLVSLLEQLEPVAQFALRYVDADRFVFDVRLRGSEQELVMALARDGQLVAVPAPLRTPQASPGAVSPTGEAAPGAAAPAADLYYRLVD
jgi:hypothetical protein